MHGPCTGMVCAENVSGGRSTGERETHSPDLEQQETELKRGLKRFVFNPPLFSLLDPGLPPLNLGLHYQNERQRSLHVRLRGLRVHLRRCCHRAEERALECLNLTSLATF